MSRESELFATPYVDRPAAASRPRRSRRWPASLAPTASAICPSRRSRAPSASRPSAFAAPASPGSYPTPTGQQLYQVEAAKPPQRRAAAYALRPASAGRRAGTSRRAVVRPEDRPAFDAVLPLEVGQVIEVVLGVLRLGGRSFAGTGGARRSTPGSRRSTPRRRWRRAARRPAASVRSMSATSGSAKTRRFLCRFFHQGSGK